MNQLSTQDGSRSILFLTSTNLACNPRCLKEVRLAAANKMNVTVVAFRLGNWSDDREREIVNEMANVRVHYLDITRQQFVPWLRATVFIKAARLIHSVFPDNVFWASIAINKQSWALWNWAKSYKGSPDLIVAHNPPAFYAAEKLASKNGVPFAIDVEDYHPGEIDNTTIESPLTVVMRNLMSRSAYNSFAAPRIRAYCRQALGIDRDTDIVVNNVFPSNEFSYCGDEGMGKMKLVWFSQNIDRGRGLEELISSLEELAADIELTLIGDPKEPFCHDFVQGKGFIKVIHPVGQQELHRIIGNADIGLALETGKDINRKLTLTNKIWAYYQAGLFVLAFDTPAQSEFLSHYPDHGMVTALDRNSITEALGLLLRRLPEIRSKKQMRLAQAKQSDWEQESVKLLNVWKGIIQCN
jgi:glycosyltransferase involved in cell wall biosynthesis